MCTTYVQRCRQGDVVLYRWSWTQSWTSTTTRISSVMQSTLAVFRAILQHQLHRAPRTCLVVMTTLWRHLMTIRSRLWLWCVEMTSRGRRRNASAAVCAPQLLFLCLRHTEYTGWVRIQYPNTKITISVQCENTFAPNFPRSSHTILCKPA